MGNGAANSEAQEKSRTAGEAGWHVSRYNVSAKVPDSKMVAIANLFKGNCAEYTPIELYLLSVLEELDDVVDVAGHACGAGKLARIPLVVFFYDVGLVVFTDLLMLGRIEFDPGSVLVPGCRDDHRLVDLDLTFIIGEQFLAILTAPGGFSSRLCAGDRLALMLCQRKVVDHLCIIFYSRILSFSQVLPLLLRSTIEKYGLQCVTSVKAYPPMVVRLAGMLMLLKFVHPLNAYPPMVVN